MADTSEMLCEGCGEQPATHHICFGGSGQTKNLCAACYEKDAPSQDLGKQGELSEVIKNGKCTFCGKPAKGGWTSGGGFGEFGWQMQELWCEECVNDLKEFYERPEQREAMESEIDVADEKALERVAQQLNEREAAKRQFMHLKILNRRGGGCA